MTSSDEAAALPVLLLQIQVLKRSAISRSNLINWYVRQNARNCWLTSNGLRRNCYNAITECSVIRGSCIRKRTANRLLDKELVRGWGMEISLNRDDGPLKRRLKERMQQTVQSIRLTECCSEFNVRTAR
jgi:hypothetical protein